MSKRNKARDRKAKTQNFKNPQYYVGQRFTIVSFTTKDTSYGDKVVQVFCKDEKGNEINFAFTNPAARQQKYTPGQTVEMNRSTQGDLVDYTWLE